MRLSSAAFLTELNCVFIAGERQTHWLILLLIVGMQPACVAFGSLAPRYSPPRSLCWRSSRVCLPENVYERAEQHARLRRSVSVDVGARWHSVSRCFEQFMRSPYSWKFVEQTDIRWARLLGEMFVCVWWRHATIFETTMQQWKI